MRLSHPFPVRSWNEFHHGCILMFSVSMLLLSLVFLLASVISVISGSTSLITVPVMLAADIEPRTAVATNMLALTCMSLGGVLPFWGKGIIDWQRSPLLIGLTLGSSMLGALLVLVVPAKSMPLIIALAMIAIPLFSMSQPEAGLVTAETPPSRVQVFLGYGATALLGIYGGFFSGGYVTLLTAAYVAWFRMTFIQAIATTKLMNIFSSLVATAVFASQGLVDYSLGFILGLSMFIGGVIGGQLCLKLSNLWLKRIYLTVVCLLAAFTLGKFWQF